MRRIKPQRYAQSGEAAAKPGAIHGQSSPLLPSLGAVAHLIAAPFLAERERWLLWLPVFFALGIGIYFALPIEPPIWLGMAGLGFLVLFAMAGRLAPPTLIPALIGLLLASGFTVAQVRTAMVAAPVLQTETGAVDVIGTVKAVEPRKRGVRLLMGRLDIEGLEPRETPDRIRITVANGAPGIEVGDRVTALAILRPPPAPVSPGAFDFGRYAFFRQIGAVGFVLGHVDLLPGPPQATGIQANAIVAGVRHSLAEEVRSALTGDKGAVAAALMTGERGAVSSSTMEALRHAGLAHLLAISGLHVGLVAGLVFAVARTLLASLAPIALRWPIKKWAALASALSAGAYLVLVGATVPTQRAFLMTLVVLLGVVLDRTAVSMRLVAWAAFIVLVARPETLLSVSFQMSFAATTALVAAYEALRESRLGQRMQGGTLRRVLVYVASVALTSVIAAMATAPFAAFHFNRVALYSLCANMVAVPIMAFWVMPWALASYVFACLGAINIGLDPMGRGVAAIIATARTVSAWPGASPLFPTPPMTALLLVVAGALWLCLWRRRWRLFGLAPIAFGLAIASFGPRPDVLVGREAGLIAVRGEAGDLWLSSKREATFSAEMWLRRAGQRTAKTFPQVGTTEGVDLSCDPLSCIYRRDKHTVALVRDARALAEDCAHATLLIATVPVNRSSCPAPLAVIDRFDIWRRGAHTLSISDTWWETRTVRRVRGARPWVRQPGAGQ